MPEFFTVDRNDSLTSGETLNVDTDFTGRRFFPVAGNYTRNDLESLVHNLFPGGLSEHGKTYLLDEFIIVSDANGPTPYVPNTPVVELVTELVRRLSFPHRPSRFACVFGWATLGEARSFKNSHGAPNASIFRVSCDSSFRCDMNLLYLGGTILGSWLFASQYWRGNSGSNPRWEELLVPPVEVLEKIE
jgi:hypothetical protein